MSDYALVVGIETYETQRVMSLQGPSLNALSFALWLAKLGVPPKNILLFHNMSKAWEGEAKVDYDKVLQKLKDRKVQVREEPTYPAIYKAWREELLTGPPEEADTLWFYWSGHGMAFDVDKEALLCSDMDSGDPTFFYISEFTKSFLSEKYSRFETQRIIIDACTEQATYDDLEIAAIREPYKFKAILGRDQTVWNAVAKGEKAGAVQGATIFTSVLLKKLEEARGWPEDIKTFYEATTKAIADLTQDATKRPRLSITSRFYNDLGGDSENAAKCRAMLRLLASCKIPFERYQPLYQRTIGNLAPDEGMSEASTLTAMMQVLLDLKAEEGFGDLSRAMVEFLSRVVREFPAEAGPVKDWLEKRVPVGGRETIATVLNKEKRDLALAIILIEDASVNGFPVHLSACLAETGFSRQVKQWPDCESKEAGDLESRVHDILLAARSLAVKQGVHLTVHIYANPPLLGFPYHALPLNPANKKDSRVFSQFHPLVLRSRARLRRDDPYYDMDAWRKKLKVLRDLQGSKVAFYPALCWKDSIQDEFAKVDGLLLIRDVVGPSRPEQDLLQAALECGLPLMSWRVEPPDSWDDFEEKLKGVFQTFAKIGEVPQQFREVRGAEVWARKTALLWDDDDNDPLRALLGEEPPLE